VDYARNRIVGGLSAGDWVLSRELVLDGDQATLTYRFLANRPIHEVHLTIAHSNWYYLAAVPTSNGFTASAARATRADIEQGLGAHPAYEVSVEVQPAGPVLPDPVQVGTVTPFGIQSVLTRYLVLDPPIGDIVPIASERIRSRAVTE
jgi:hypothetical protein